MSAYHGTQVVREASKRVLGLRPFDVQLIGGMILHKGEIAEMRTGEGKTLVAVLPTTSMPSQAKASRYCRAALPSLCCFPAPSLDEAALHRLDSAVTGFHMCVAAT